MLEQPKLNELFVDPKCQQREWTKSDCDYRCRMLKAQKWLAYAIPINDIFKIILNANATLWIITFVKIGR